MDDATPPPDDIGRCGIASGDCVNFRSLIGEILRAPVNIEALSSSLPPLLLPI